MGFIENVNYLAEHLGEVTEEVKKVANSVENIDKVSLNMDDVEKVANDLDKVDKVADNIDNVSAVGKSIDNVNKVADDLENIDIVADNIDSVNITAKSIDDINTYAKTYLGSFDKPPTTRNDGTPLLEGDLYYDLNDKAIKVWNGSEWTIGITEAKNEITPIVDDRIDYAFDTNVGIQTVKRFLIYPYTKQSFTPNNTNILFQTMDLKYLITTGSNVNGYVVVGLGINTINGYVAIPSPNPGVPLKKIIAAGCGNYVLIFEDGKVYGWGQNKYGQLGLGHTNVVPIPTFITDGVIDGESSSCGKGCRYGDYVGSLYLIKKDGTLWVAGCNTIGQLGLGHNDNVNKLTLSFSKGRVKKIVLGSDGYNNNATAMILTDSGKVYGTGRNDYGQLGTGDNISRNIWTPPVVFLSNDRIGIYKGNDFIDIGMAIGGIFSYLITDNGRVFFAGNGYWGNIGDGNLNQPHNFYRFKEMFYSEDYCNMYDSDGFPIILDPIVEVKCGGCNAFFRTKNGTLYGIGCNGAYHYGVFGLGDIYVRGILTKLITNVETFALFSGSGNGIGMFRSIIVKTYDDGFYGTGINSYGSLGIGVREGVNVWTKTLHTKDAFENFTGFFFSGGGEYSSTLYVLTKNGVVYASGHNGSGQASLYSSENGGSICFPTIFN